VFILAVSAMTPLTVVAGAIPLGYGEVKETGIPVAYAFVAAVLGIFAVGLAAMARHVPNSGAFYAYATAGIGRPAGVATAFIALVAYNAMQIGLYGAFGIAAETAGEVFGVHFYWGFWVLLAWLAVGTLGLVKISLNARILTVLVCAEVVIVLTLDIVMLGHPHGGTVSLATLNPGLLASAGGISMMVGAVAGMVGFETPLLYASLTKDPRRTVARAIGLTLLLGAVLYGGSAWAMSVISGPDNIIAIASKHTTDLFFYLPKPHVAGWVMDIAAVLFATSLFAAMLAFHHTVARYSLTLAREGVLPAWLARTRADEVPVGGSVVQSTLALVVLLLALVLHFDPTRDLFFYGTVSGGLGVLILMTVAAVAVVRFFRRNPHGETRWRRAIAPGISAVFLILILLVTVAFFGELLGSDDPLRVWSAPLAFLLVAAAGVGWARALRRHRPGTYEAIGHGGPTTDPQGAAVRDRNGYDLADQVPAYQMPDDRYPRRTGGY
jgi:amino acid transporter